MKFLELPASQFIIFQLQWWSSILFVRSGYPSVGASIAFSLCFIEYLLLKFSLNRIKILVACIILGIWMDSLLSYFGIFIYKYYVVGIDWFIPVWAIAIWFSFSTWISLSPYLRNYKGLVTLATIFFAPLSYFAGNNFSVVKLKYQTLSLFLIGLSWVLFMNIILRWPRVNEDTVLDSKKSY